MTRFLLAVSSESCEESNCSNGTKDD